MSHKKVRSRPAGSAPEPSRRAAATPRHRQDADDTVETQHGSAARFRSFMRQRVATLSPRPDAPAPAAAAAGAAPLPIAGALLAPQPAGAAAIAPGFRKELLAE